MRSKKIDEYNDKYGNISNNLNERLNYLFERGKFDNNLLSKIRYMINRNLKLKFKSLTFVFYFIPQATPRPRSSRFSKVFYVKNAINYNELFGNFVKSCEEIDFKISTPCKFITKTYAPTPSSMSKEESILAELELIKNISKPDWDNLGKTYSDMVQKHLIIDDSLIFDGRVQKFYSIKPRIEITIEYMEDYDSEYNKRKVRKWKCYE